MSILHYASLIIMMVLLFLGLPIAFVLGTTSLIWLYLAEISLRVVPMRMYGGINRFVLLAIPFFILAGEIMNESGITKRLVRFVEIIIGRVRGGLAHVNIYSSLLFAGISGSAIADVSAIGSLLIPAMEKGGYTKRFSAMITASSSIVGPIIPPSITIVLYGSVTGASIAGMFAASIVPGILIGVGQSIMVMIFAKKKNLPKSTIKTTRKEFFAVSKDATAALIMPIIILGGILGGIFTPTEAGAIACAYAILVGFLLFKELRVSVIPEILLKAVKTSAILFLIIGAADILGWLLAMEGIPRMLAGFLLGITEHQILLFFIILVFLLFLGTWLEAGASIIMLSAVLPPAMIQIGFHPLQTGVIIVVAMLIGLITPPLGLCLFTASSVSGAEVEEIFMEILPFISVHIIVLVLVGIIPELTLFVPRLLGLI